MRRIGQSGIAVRLALAAIVLRALLPLGYMPNPAGFADGTPIVICTAGGAMQQSGDPADPGDGAPASHDAPCIFAAVVPLDIPASAVLPPPPGIASRDALLPAMPRSVRYSGGPLGARAPPLS